ncbi:unnamed protein product [Caenorhabditis bovis]|uniref:AXH domain-containing protein n=1 Tax=Caenorhabditis bovis TaxID=2654633 RepID=A0A8S1EV52_9PELO|nr:unnamed protein product [Caenorhabditis bovis]
MNAGDANTQILNLLTTNPELIPYYLTLCQLQTPQNANELNANATAVQNTPSESLGIVENATHEIPGVLRSSTVICQTPTSSEATTNLQTNRQVDSSPSENTKRKASDDSEGVPTSRKRISMADSEDEPENPHDDCCHLNRSTLSSSNYTSFEPTMESSTIRREHETLEASSRRIGGIPTSTYYPTHFMHGTVLQLANGATRRVEDVSSDDFLRCAAESDDVNVNAAIVSRISPSADAVTVRFAVGARRRLVELAVQHEHPLFVLGKGWTSCDVKRTVENYGLRCEPLEIGDVCIVLTRESSNDEAGIVSISEADRQFDEWNRRNRINESLAAEYFDEDDRGRASAPPRFRSSAIFRERAMSF